MNRLVLLAALLSAGPVSTLHAAAVDCLPSTRCPKGQRPPACCAPPPCEFFHELKVAKALRRALNTLNPTEIALKAGVDDPEAPRRQFNRELREQLRQEHRRFVKCPRNAFYERVPSMTTIGSRQCQLIDPDGQPASLQKELASSNSCVELVEAEFARAKQARLNCLAFQNETEPRTVSEIRAQFLMETEAQIASLEASLLQYWGSCSSKADARTALRALQAGMKPLKKARAKRSNSGGRHPKRSAQANSAPTA